MPLQVDQHEEYCAILFNHMTMLLIYTHRIPPANNFEQQYYWRSSITANYVTPGVSYSTYLKLW